MWPAENGVYLVVGSQRIQCARVVDGRWQPESVASLAIDGGPAASLAALALPATAAHSRAVLRVLVSDRWLNAAEVLWHQALAHDGERAAAHVRQRLVDAGFSATESVQIRLDDAGFGQPRLAVGYPEDLIAALTALARRSGMRLHSVLPLGVAAWRVNAKRDAVAIVEEGSIVVATSDKRRLRDVMVRLSGAPWDAHWARVRLRDARQGDVAHPAVVDLRSGNGAPISPALGLARAARNARLPVDAIVQRPRGVGAWLAAACVTILAAGLSLQAWQVHSQLAAAKATLRALQHLPAAAPVAIPWSRQESARIQSVNAAVRELNLPIAALLAALQPPRDLRVAVLGVDVSGLSTARITAETRTAAEMAKYAAFVASRSPFTQAYVVHHEIDLALPERPYRFALEASWRD